MIIIMANDQMHYHSGNVLRKRYYGNDTTQLAVFTAGCFTHLKDRRITFLGHAHNDNFGGHKPEEFVERLTNPKNGPVLPHTVADIDLIGCEVGLIKKDNSYMNKVAELLGERGYKLRIHAFSNLNAQEELAGMLVYVQDDGNVSVTGWTEEKSTLIDSIRFNLANLDKEKKRVDDDILTLENETKLLSTHSDIIELQRNAIRMNETMIVTLEQQISLFHALHPSTSGSVSPEKINVEDLSRKITQLKNENTSSSKAIEEMEKNEKMKRIDISQERSTLSFTLHKINEDIAKLKTKLKEEQNKVVIIVNSPLRETLDSKADYQVVTHSSVHKNEIPLSPPNNTASPLFPPSGAAFTFQAHRIWESDNHESKWDNDKYSEPKLQPLLPPKEEDKTTLKPEGEKQNDFSDSKETESNSSPHLRKH